MMRESLWRRLEAVEESRRLRKAALESVYIVFPGLDPTQHISGPRGFICHRDTGEALDQFERRADGAFRLANPHWPLPAVLIFMGDLNNPMKSMASA
jgi:hypothetical protein